MPRDLRHLLEDTAVEPSRPIDPTHIVDRARRQTLLARTAVSVVAVVVVVLGAVAISQIPRGQAPEIAAQPTQPGNDNTRQSPTTSESAAPTPMTLSEGQRRWQDSKPDSYRMTVKLECFCLMAGTWEITVTDGSVEGHMLRDTRGWVADADTPTIDRLYEWATNKADTFPDAQIEATIDKRGVPWGVDLDAPDVVDEELAWSINDYTAIEFSPSDDPVRVLDSAVENGTTLRLGLNVCSPDRYYAEVTRTTDEAVHVRATAHGGSMDDCSTLARVTLDEPLGERKVIDHTTGEEIRTTG